jgi:hypothetical protein
MKRRVRPEIQSLIEELQSWLPNYNHGPNDYPTLLWRLIASMPGGDRAEDMGYEEFNLGWHEIDQLGRVLVAIQDKADVEDLVDGLLGDEDEGLEEAPRRSGTGADVYDYQSGEQLAGSASPDLTARSRAAGPTGAVPAYRDERGVWQYVQPQDQEHYRRNLGISVRTVFVHSTAGSSEAARRPRTRSHRRR